MVPYTAIVTSQNQGPNDLADPVAGASVTVIVAATQQLETLTDLSGNPLPQPVITDALGNLQFGVPSPGNNYILQYRYGGRLLRQDQVSIGPGGDLAEINAALALLPDLALTGNAPPASGVYRSGGVLQIAP